MISPMRQVGPNEQGTRRIGIGLALAAAVISGFSVYVNAQAVRAFGDPLLYTTIKNLIAAVGLLALVSLTEPVITIAFSRILDRAFIAEKTVAAASQGVAMMPAQSALSQSAIFAWLSSVLDAMPTRPAAA